jgi:hypothetical protein
VSPGAAEVRTVLTAVAALAGAVARLTPTPADDVVVAGITAVLNDDLVVNLIVKLLGLSHAERAALRS